MQPLKISLETAQKLAKALGVPIEQIMHMPPHILVNKLLELEKNEKKRPVLTVWPLAVKPPLYTTPAQATFPLFRSSKPPNGKKTPPIAERLAALAIIRFPLRCLMLKPELIGHHGDEFRVCRLCLRDAHRIAEQRGNRFEVAAAPSDFDRMANGALDAAGGRVVVFSRCPDRALS